MIPDLSSIFSAYERLRDQADLIFAQVAKSQGPECVTCHKGCSDCCNALFDLSLVEAMYINHAFIKAFDYGPKRSEILTRADRADRQLTRMKRDLFHEEKKGIDTMTIMNDAATMRMRCPLLGDDGLCELYDARPITCRLYGIPTVIGNQGHVCGFSGFKEGMKYPTVKLDKIQNALQDMSLAIERGVQSRFDKLHEVYMPLSMALLTNFDESFLGIGPAKHED